MDEALEVCALGGLTIRQDGVPVTGFVSRKAEALVVDLACIRQAQAREFLAELQANGTLCKRFDARQLRAKGAVR
jgi:hypothetical protein